MVFLRNKLFFATAFFFSCFSLIFSTWVTYIPYVVAKLEMSKAQLGSALFCSALGAFVMIRICRRFVDRVGVGRMAYFTLIQLSAMLLALLLAPNYITLCIFLFGLGLSTSLFGISINSLIAIVEKRAKVYIISGSHGFFSAGGMIGAGVGSILAAKMGNPVLHACIVIAIVIGVQTYFRSEYYHIRDDKPTNENKKASQNMRPLLLLAVIGLIVMVTEGAIADWSALYLKQLAPNSLSYISLGYAGFCFAMMIGRFMGDSLRKYFASWKMISFGLMIAVVGFVIVLLAHGLYTIIGFTVIGFGFSVIVPEVYRQASTKKEIETSAGVAFIAASANLGFLAGPVMLGTLAEYKGLHYSFLILSFIVVFALFVALYSYRKSMSLIFQR